MRKAPLDVALAVAGENSKLALGGGVTVLLETLEVFQGLAWCGVLGVLVDEDSGPRAGSESNRSQEPRVSLNAPPL